MKIDRSFIAALDCPVSGEASVEAITGLWKALSLTVTAEVSKPSNRQVFKADLNAIRDKIFIWVAPWRWAC